MSFLRRHGRSLPGRLLALVIACVAAAWIIHPGPVEPLSAARSIEDLISPLTVGAIVARGYTLSPPRRGEEHDVVFTARRADGGGAAIELHLLDRGRWAGIRESRSFGIAYELRIEEPDTVGPGRRRAGGSYRMALSLPPRKLSFAVQEDGIDLPPERNVAAAGLSALPCAGACLL